MRVPEGHKSEAGYALYFGILESETVIKIDGFTKEEADNVARQIVSAESDLLVLDLGSKYDGFFLINRKTLTYFRTEYENWKLHPQELQQYPRR